MLAERVGVLVAAAGAAWEVDALRALGAPGAGTVVLKRCVDLADLLASAATGQARAALVATELPGLDEDSASTLRRAGLVVVLVGDPLEGGAQPSGVRATVPASDVAGVAAVLADAVGSEQEPVPADGPLVPAVPSGAAGADGPQSTPGRLVAVWGPTGAPGRTTVAVNLAAELGRRGRDTLLVDADCYGGTVAQHLGVLDEVSGLLSAVRVANTGRLDVARLASLARSAAPGLRVLTGLPRADRWPEVRPTPYDVLLECAAVTTPYVVLDLGFDIEQGVTGLGGPGPQRNHMTVAALDRADEVVVVGSADPVGLARLARALVELPEVVPAATTRVVVNRVRPSLGWGEQEVRAMVEGFVTPASMHFLPFDTVVDRALIAGRPVRDVGDSPLSRAVAGLADAVEGESGARGRRPTPRLRRRRAGRAP